MINKLLTVGLSFIIGLGLFATLNHVKDDIKNSMSVTQHIKILEDFDDGAVYGADNYSWNELVADLDYLVGINVGGLETIPAEVDYITADVISINTDDGPVDLYISGDIWINDGTSLSTYPPGAVYGDGGLYIVVELPVENTLTRLVDILPILSLMVLITTGIVVVKFKK